MRSAHRGLFKLMKAHQPSLKGLYAITPSGAYEPEQLLQKVKQAILGGARVIQYRDKDSNHQRKEKGARALLGLCQRYNIPLIINDDVDLAQRITADGIHIGAEDMSIIQARQALGPNAIIGVSCYNDLKQAKQAATQGANYVAFGRFFASQSKPEASLADIQTLHQARQELDLPIVVIGGITAKNGQALLDAGADMLAVIHGVFGAVDIRQAAGEINQLFK